MLPGHPDVQGETGVIDLARRRMMMTMQERSGGESLSQELRVIGGTSYVKTDGEWLSMSFGLAETGTADPGSYLDFLQGVSDDVRVDGHDILRGDATTRYRATVSLDRALTRAGGATARQTALRRVVEQLGHINIPVTVWVDGSGRLRRCGCRSISPRSRPASGRRRAPIRRWTRRSSSATSAPR